MNSNGYRLMVGRPIAIITAIILASTIFWGGMYDPSQSAYASSNAPNADVSGQSFQEISQRALEDAAAVEPAAEAIKSSAKVEVETIDTSLSQSTKLNTSAVSATSNELKINNVEVLTRGDIQNLYRDTVYKGEVSNGEDPAKWYTTYREFNLKDPRIFNLQFKVSAADVGSNREAYLNSVSLNYGGVSIDKWGNGTELRGSTKIFEITDKRIEDNGDGTYTVSLSLQSKSPYSATPIVDQDANGNNITENAQGTRSAITNTPYNGYYAGNQSNFVPSGGQAQSGDNRNYWKAGPTYKGMGTYELAAMVSGSAVAATNVHIGPYDEMYSWLEMNDYAQSLVKALTGAEIPKTELDKKPIGTLAKGYIAQDSNGNFVKGNRATDVYVEVSIIGYGLTDNYKTENKDFNNYSRYNAQWNVVVSYDENKVNTYLNETVPTMNNNPQALIDKYKDKDPKDIDMINVYYQNNTHADEVTGVDSSIKLINDLIDGGKAGKEIPYKTFEYDDINLRYRVPTDGFAQNNSSHTVKDTYGTAGAFMDPDSRQDAVFDTKEALDKMIFVTTLCSNPDGKAGMRRVNRYGLDMNRDVVFSTQPETISLTKDIAKWDPLLLNEWHGYVTQMLIEPCTAPHAPTFEYDLLQNNMLQLAYRAGLAITANTGYSDFRIPWDHLAGGAWDDGGTIYAPMFAMLYGTYGYTVEFPHSNSDSFDAGNVLNYAMLDTLLTGETKFFEGNKLNGELKDLDGKTRDSHVVDNKDTSMRKSSVMNKLEVKRRGVENIDSEAADKYFIDNRGGEDVVVGRPRPDDGKGGKLSFFPDYLVVPVDAVSQYNIAEGIKGVNHMIRLGAKVSVATEDIQYKGKTIAKGAYVFDMKQANRNLIFEIMGKGYDATGFPSMYADIYCNYPDVRGFDSIQVYGASLYNGKLKALTGEITKTADIKGTAADYVVFKSQSTDAVRFVNLLLSGRSSGPSTAEKGDVWMLRKTVAGVGNASDYVINKKDLSKINNLIDNKDLGLIGCHIEGKYISALPKEAVKLVEPIIQYNTTRTAQTGGVLWWAMDDYLGFGSMVDYNGSTTLRPGANVIVSNNAAPSASIISAAKEQKLGMVLIQNASILTDANFGTGNASAPTTVALSDVALNGKYNINDSLFTSNYANTTTLYARGNAYTGNIPVGAKTLFKSSMSGTDAFIGGWQNTSGAKTTFGDRTLAFSTILKGGGITGKPIQALVIGQQMNNRSHYQKLLPMLATGIYAGAAGILDDFKDPQIADMEKQGNRIVATASDSVGTIAESGVDKLTIYGWNGSQYVKVVDQNDANDHARIVFNASATDQKYKVVALDYAGNESTRYFLYSAANGQLYNMDDEKSLLEFGESKVTLGSTAGGSVSGAGTYKTGEMVQLAAKPSAGYEFMGWYDQVTNNLVSHANPYSFTIKSNVSLVARFVPTLLNNTNTNTAGIQIGGVHAAISASVTYTGKALKPAVVVPGLVAGVDYTITYSNNMKVGVASVVLHGKGKYTGTKGLTYKIVPKKAVINSISIGKKKVTVKWAHSVDSAGKYQIRYKVKGASKWITKTVSEPKTSLVIHNLKKGKQYQVQVRAFKSIDGNAWHGAWSKVAASKKVK